MSLKIITDKNDIQCKYVDYNDIFFQSVPLIDSEITKRILSSIDRAEYASKDTFIGRDRTLGALNKALLSSGCKTLINIAYNPNICFSVAECGQNALKELACIHDGIIYWDKPMLFLLEDVECDIEHKGIHYTKYMDFLNKVMND